MIETERQHRLRETLDDFLSSPEHLLVVHLAATHNANGSPLGSTGQTYAIVRWLSLLDATHCDDVIVWTTSHRQAEEIYNAVFQLVSDQSNAPTIWFRHIEEGVPPELSDQSRQIGVVMRGETLSSLAIGTLLTHRCVFCFGHNTQTQLSVSSEVTYRVYQM
jgi:hypothetical protein